MYRIWFRREANFRRFHHDDDLEGKSTSQKSSIFSNVWEFQSQSSQISHFLEEPSRLFPSIMSLMNHDLDLSQETTNFCIWQLICSGSDRQWAVMLLELRWSPRAIGSIWVGRSALIFSRDWICTFSIIVWEIISFFLQ